MQRGGTTIVSEQCRPRGGRGGTSTSLGEKERDARKAAERSRKRPAVSPAANSVVGRQERLPRQFAAAFPLLRAFHARLRSRGVRDSASARWCADTTYLSCTHHTRCVFYRWRTTCPAPRGTLTFLPANRTATRGKIACALRCLCYERSEMRPQTSQSKRLRYTRKIIRLASSSSSLRSTRRRDYRRDQMVIAHFELRYTTLFREGSSSIVTGNRAPRALTSRDTRVERKPLCARLSR